MVTVPQRCVADGLVIGALERPLGCRVLPCPVMAGTWRCRFDPLPTHRKNEKSSASLSLSDYSCSPKFLRAPCSDLTARYPLGNGDTHSDRISAGTITVPKLVEPRASDGFSISIPEELSGMLIY
jgi:hypothetical protein